MWTEVLASPHGMASRTAMTQRSGVSRANASFSLRRTNAVAFPSRERTPTRRRRCQVRAARSDPVQEQEKTESTTKEEEVERVTKKWGLEAGLFKAMTSKKADGSTSGGQTAKELLKKYGSAYLITSISFAIVSFIICYVLVDIGVDVSALLAKVGIQVSGTGEKVGTAAIAYAAHKAASPIRFPPTVALTPVVANWLGRGQEKNTTDGEDSV